ncbi:phosphorylase [Candidatus Methylospira mobilis]|uniref:Phosphorylase n=1 Tax=Candidatus Methylospira mobilis TaxID=1808979 RepID=A0A5Q0BMD6_9GAMM|nr:phosphorylase [Candidatus Methylospira mobilis]QFY44769.1 phosphorylase [Candidatus Methylospira mobilis]WNV05690.1 phosphorylase [Candidatus Methylospira mobilis]
MNKAGFLVALKAECGSLTKTRVRIGECIRLEDGSLMAFSGVGPEAAERAARRLLAEGAGFLVSWGCAAALDSALMPGALVLASHVIEYNGSVRPTDDELRNRLAGKLSASRLNIHQAALVESRQIVATPQAKAGLLQRYGALAVDMESGAVARCAARNQVPFLAVRAIADTAAMTVPASVLAASGENGNIHLPLLLRHVLLKPAEIAALIRLGRHFSAAARTLRAVRIYMNA